MMETKHILVLIEFKSDNTEIGTHGSRQYQKGTPNEIRRAFLGLSRGSPNVIKKLQERVKSKEQVISPVHFSLLKNPTKIKTSDGKYRLRNSAVGVMVLYEYLGVIEDLTKFLNLFNENLEEIFKPGRYNFSSSCSKFEIFECNKFT